ncbi:MAG: hypothetical protein V3W41_00720 [Planctomycetota bacterium]
MVNSTVWFLLALLLFGLSLVGQEMQKPVLRFEDVSESAGIEAARGPAGRWFDFDLDGCLDVGTASGEVWINNQKGALVDFSKSIGIALPHGSASAINRRNSFENSLGVGRRRRLSTLPSRV